MSKASFFSLNILVALFFSLAFQLSIQTVAAQVVEQTALSPEAIGYTVTPPTAYIRVKPGSQTTHTVTIENTSRRALTIQPRIVDFATDGKTGAPILQNFTTFPHLKFQDGRSIDAGFDQVELLPGQKAQLTMLIGVPPTAEEKEWPLTVLFFAENTTVGVPDSNTLLQASLGSNMIVLVSKESELTRKLAVLASNVPQVTDSLRPLIIKPILKNTHYAATIASGSASLKDWRGNIVEEHDFYPDVILGYSSREVQAMSTSNQSEVITERIPITFRPQFFFGFYTVTLTSITTDDLYQELFTQQVIALPFMALAILVVISLIGTSYWYFQKKDLP